MVIGRPLAFEPDQALEDAMQVFWKTGYEATSLQHLLRATGLSKSSLYQAFGSKQELFDRCVQRYLDETTEALIGDLNESPSGRRFIEDTFLSAARQAGTPAAKKGCLLINTTTEFGQRDPRIAKVIKSGLDRLARVFRLAVERAQREGDISPTKDPKTLASYILSSMSGLRTLMKGGLDAKSARRVARLALQALD